MPRKSKRLPTFLQATEPETLLRATSRERDRLLLMVMLMCGLRVSELCKLQVEHLEFERGVLWVREGKGSKDRAGPLPKRLIGPLRGWVGARRTGYVFPSPRGGRLSTRAVQVLVKRTAARAGLVDALANRKYTPHKLRHAFCTRLLDAGVPIHDVRDLMGHSSIAVTDRYSHCAPERLREAVDSVYR